MRSMKLAIIMAAASLASACAGGITPPPGSAGTLPPAVEIAGTAVTKGGIGAETAYYAANRAAALGIRTGFITSPATIKRIGELDNQGKAALDKIRRGVDAYAELDSVAKSILALVPAFLIPKE